MSENKGEFRLAAASIARSGCLWAISVVIATFGGAAALGEFALALAIASPIFVFSELGMRNVVITYSGHVSERQVVTLRFATATTATAVVIAVSASGGTTPLGISAALGVAKMGDSLLDICYGILQRHRRLTLVANALTMNGLSLMVAFSVVFWLTESLTLALCGWALASITCLVFLVASMRTKIEAHTSNIKPGHRTAKALLRAGLPTGAAQGVGSLITYLPIIALGTWGQPDEVGIFSAISYFVTFASLALAALQSATLPGLAYAYRHKAENFTSTNKRYIRTFLVIALAGAALIATLGGDALTAIYGTEFVAPRSAIALIALSVAALGPVYVCAGWVLVANRYGAQLMASAAALLVTLTFIVAVSGSFGLLEAAGVVAVSSFARWAFGYWAARGKLTV